jgi:hypothetical protein
MIARAVAVLLALTTPALAQSALPDPARTHFPTHPNPNAATARMFPSLPTIEIMIGLVE